MLLDLDFFPACRAYMPSSDASDGVNCVLKRSKRYRNRCACVRTVESCTSLLGRPTPVMGSVCWRQSAGSLDGRASPQRWQVATNGVRQSLRDTLQTWRMPIKTSYGDTAGRHVKHSVTMVANSARGVSVLQSRSVQCSDESTIRSVSSTIVNEFLFRRTKQLHISRWRTTKLYSKLV